MWKMASFIFWAVAMGCILCGSGLADDKDDVKKAIAIQFELLKAGKAAELKGHFTKRLQAQITPELVEKARKATEKITLEELVDVVEIGKEKEMKAARIKMKSGRSLTTLVFTDGKWLADTIWFK